MTSHKCGRGRGWVPDLVMAVAPVSNVPFLPLQYVQEPQVGMQPPALPGDLCGLR